MANEDNGTMLTFPPVLLVLESIGWPEKVKNKLVEVCRTAFDTLLENIVKIDNGQQRDLKEIFARVRNADLRAQTLIYLVCKDKFEINISSLHSRVITLHNLER